MSVFASLQSAELLADGEAQAGANSFVGALSALGGSGYQYGGAGTIYTKAASKSWGELKLDNGGHAGAVTTLSSNTNTFDKLLVRGQARMSVPTNAVLRLVPPLLSVSGPSELSFAGQLNCTGVVVSAGNKIPAKAGTPGSRSADYVPRKAEEL